MTLIQTLVYGSPLEDIIFRKLEFSISYIVGPKSSKKATSRFVEYDFENYSWEWFISLVGSYEYKKFPLDLNADI